MEQQMDTDSLKQSVSEHSGVFHCVARGNNAVSKQVEFHHLFDPPGSIATVPEVGGLKAFYSVFGNLRLYHHDQSGDSAFFIASPEQWDSLMGYFRGWIDSLDEAEKRQLLPDWIDDCIALGEIPRSGNYLLMPTDGSKAGRLFEFEHDGFELVELGSNLIEFVSHAIDPTGKTLRSMASHMTFIEDDPMEQWWIEAMHDNRGNIVRTRPGTG